MKLPELIPLKVLFGNPERASPEVSPDGKMVAYLAPSDKDVLNVWLRAPDGKERMLTNDTHRGIRSFQWVENNTSILYQQDKDGDENFHVYMQPLQEGTEAKDITPFDGVKAQNIVTDKHFPNQLLVGLNRRDKTLFDMHRIDLISGETVLDTENPGDVLAWLTDPSFKIRGAYAMDSKDGSKMLRIRDDESSEWREVYKWAFDEEGDPVCFTQDGKSIYITTSIDHDTTRLIKISQQDGKEEELITMDPKVNVGNILIDENTKKIQAVSFNYLRRTWQVIDPDIQEDFKKIQELEEGDFSITTSNSDNTVWTIVCTRDDGSSRNYLYDRNTKKATFLFQNIPKLDEFTLARMKTVVIKARDGLELPCYLTLPVGCEEEGECKNVPLVLNVHGGPWARDVWGCNPTVQWLANRGYAVLQVNYRGSTGYGKKYLHLGDKQWGVGTMQHDLTDAVEWAIQQGIADPKKVAIFGGSYGGYAVLAGLTFTPELYCCGVDIVGVSHVRTLFQSIPPYWEPMKRKLIQQVGDVEADDNWNKTISPLFHAHKIKVPLIIAQGANDPRVKQAEADQIYEVLKANGQGVEYFLYEDEGHGFARPPNRLDFFSRIDQFLSKILGGRAEEPLAMENTSVKIMHELSN